MKFQERLKNLDTFEIGLLLYNIFLIIQAWLGNINLLNVGLLLWFELTLAGISEIIIGLINKTAQKFALFYKLLSFLFFMTVSYSIIGATMYAFMSDRWIYFVIMAGLFIVRLFFNTQSRKEVFEYVLVKILLFVVLFVLSIVILGSTNMFSVSTFSKAILSCILLPKIVVDFFIYSHT